MNSEGSADKPIALDSDSESEAENAVVQIHNCDVMIGLFRCIVDLYFQNDRMCMRNVRGKHDAWPFKSSLYKVSKDAENEVVDSEQMEQLLGEASYVAFKLPLLEETEQDAVKTFYDPADDGTWFDL
ncbi:hypothetical protein PHYSODRAFT_514541 [Phytophthora sojae]|uniref:Uncharacterized protein n=1 Tax=Phytophthora sojae (strain P6497) TaxID=1094619 RepID=G4ZV14_PHYSP|nr:hypothetical protein PHYSODRAFT_514541 [Phytophthora sojae]EGZ13638.1 hypothetical protein PHYSODRAFT_514541 [Phytophthora sojae]|eukprot:XP_009531067.1 hypothetical protein PHYSODRAFT_514541 [Phytophthora sojae]